MESRVGTTRLVGEAIAMSSSPPKLWMNASTATIYRHATDRAMDEVDGEIGGGEAGLPSSWRFSYEVAKRWEQTFFESNTPGTRKIAMRSGIVMSPRPGRCVRDAPEPGPRRFGRRGRFRPPVLVVDPRRGLRRGDRIPDRPPRS